MAGIFRTSVRSLRHTPGITLVVITTLSVGIALVSAIFALVNGYQWAELPYENADRIVAIGLRQPILSADQMPSEFIPAVRQVGSLFMATAVYEQRFQTIRTNGSTFPVDVLAAESSLLPLLGVQPDAGRFFGDDDPGDVAVLSYAAARKYFTNPRSAVGQTIHVDRRSYSVIGIMPPDIGFQRADAIIPFEGAPSGWIHMLGRLRDGVTPEAASSRLSSLPVPPSPDYGSGSAIAVDPDMAQRGSVLNAGLILILFIAATLSVLVIACVNVVAVMLARGVTRRSSYAIRSTLGASRARLMVENMAESMIVACVAAVAGLILASWSISLFVARYGAAFPSWLKFPIDFRVMIFATFAALFTMLAIGFMPAREAANAGPISLLNSTTSTKNVGDSRILRLLVSAEVALSVALFISTVLLVRSFRHAQVLDAGYDDSHIAFAHVQLDESRFAHPASIDQYIVQSMGAVDRIPAEAHGWSGRFVAFRSSANDSVPRFTDAMQANSDNAALRAEEWVVTSPDFFRTLQLPVVAGRTFTGNDNAASGLAVVISESAARALGGKGNVVGQSLAMNDSAHTNAIVIGVVGDRFHMRSNRRGTQVIAYSEFYFNDRQAIARDLSFIVRGAAPDALAGQTTRALYEGSPDVAVTRSGSLYDLNRPQTMELRMMASIFGGIAVVALPLALIGLFGVVAYSARQRTREIGIRMALGANAANIGRDVVLHALRIVGGGLAFGFALAFLFSQMMGSMLFGVSPLDPLTYAIVATCFGAVGLVAAWIPSRRAMNVDPMTALRPE